MTSFGNSRERGPSSKKGVRTGADRVGAFGSRIFMTHRSAPAGGANPRRPPAPVGSRRPESVSFTIISPGVNMHMPISDVKGAPLFRVTGFVPPERLRPKIAELGKGLFGLSGRVRIGPAHGS